MIPRSNLSSVSGTLSVLYLLSFVLIKSSIWGINVDFYVPENPFYISNFNFSFPVLTGMLALALFIHNIIITVMRNNRHQEKNVSIEQYISNVFGVRANLFSIVPGKRFVHCIRTSCVNIFNCGGSFLHRFSPK